MFKIPESLKVGWRTYRIEKRTDFLNDGDKLCGQIHFPRRLIMLNAQNDDIQDCETLIHELLHALDYQYDIGLSEKKVSRLGDALYTLLCDNGYEIIKKEGE